MARTERDLEHMFSPGTAGVGLQVVSAEPTSAQLVWSALPEGRHELTVGPRTIAVDHPGGPGAVVVDELAPATEHAVLLCPTGGEPLTRRFRTTTPPPGDELFRFATISDLHLARERYEQRRAVARGRAVGPTDPNGAALVHTTTVTTEPDAPETDRASRCARAAIDEALAWGAQLIVVKGDVCEETFDHSWDLAAALLGDLPVPVMILPGNHDTGTLREFEPELGAAARGLEVIRGVAHRDVPGLRIVAVDSTIPGSGWGDVARHAHDVADLVRGSTGGSFIATHHQPQRFTVPLYWPHGIPGPNARRFARTVTAASPAVLASSGHTHRNRRRRVAGMHWSEVAATNHYPGVWAGYTVHEGGLGQTVRRITEPEVLAWSERSRRMLGGIWALWSTGELDDRCFTLSW